MAADGCGSTLSLWVVIRENGTEPAVAVCPAGPVYRFSELVSCKILISAEVFNPPPGT